MRLLGVNIPDNKRIEISLAYVYGLGRPSVRNILKLVRINPDKKAKDLSADEIGKLGDCIGKSYKIEGTLRQIVRQNINRLRNIGCYRGVRHAKKLPVRGQRTKTNSRTVRGNVRRTAGSGKRKVELR